MIAFDSRHSLIIAVLLGALAAPEAGASPQFTKTGSGTVYWVADGDTMIVSGIAEDVYRAIRRHAEAAQRATSRNLRVDDRFNDRHRSMLVRIGNIDAPESVHHDPSLNTDQGQAAADYVRHLLTDREVEFVCWRIGFFGRPICSLYGGEFGLDFDLGVHLIEKGLAEYVDRFGLHPFWPQRYIDASKADAR